MIQVKVIFIDGYTVPFEFSVLVSVTLSDAMFIIVRRNREKYSCTISFTHFPSSIQYSIIGTLQAGFGFILHTHSDLATIMLKSQDSQVSP